MSTDIIIVAFNTDPDLLESCFASIARASAESPAPVGIIVLDNGSTIPVDDHAPGLTVIRSEANLGFGRAVNLAVRQSTADEILLLNPDATLAPGALAAFLEAHRAEPDAVLSGHLRTHAGLQIDAYLDWNYSISRKLRRARESVRVERLVQSSALVAVPKVCGGALFGRRDLLIEFGPFDERFFLYGEDADLSRRLRGAGVPLFLVPEARVDHLAASSQRQFGALVEQCRADAAIRLATYHLPWALALLQRIELMAVTVLGTLASRTSSSSRSARLARLRQIRRWSFARDLPALDPASASGRADDSEAPA